MLIPEELVENLTEFFGSCRLLSEPAERAEACSPGWSEALRAQPWDLSKEISAPRALNKACLARVKTRWVRVDEKRAATEGRPYI